MESKNGLIFGNNGRWSAYNIAISFFAFIYVVVSFGFNGLPSVSRLSLVSAVCMSSLLFFRLKGLNLPKWSIAYLFFYAYLIFPAMMLDDPPWTGMGALITIVLGSVGLGVALHNEMVSYRLLIYAMLAAAFFNILAVLAGIDTTELIYGENLPGRSAGLLGNSNFLAMTMALPGLMVALWAEEFSKFTIALSVFVATYGMVVSGSRKGIILVAAILLMLSISWFSSLNKTMRLLLVTGILAGTFLVGPYIFDLLAKYSTDVAAVDRMFQMFSGKEESYSERLWLTNLGLSIWRESPLCGEGLNQFARISGFGAYAHNNYVELLVSGGMVGAAVFYGMHLTILFKARLLPLLMRLRLVIAVCTMLFADTALVSFSDKSVMTVLCMLLVISSGYILRTRAPQPVSREASNQCLFGDDL
ncbi:MAG TPA: O-antigen ligase family protein [Geomonas sp.]|nr:O-antigen ligase family protein [Geomonas sp.]